MATLLRNKEQYNNTTEDNNQKSLLGRHDNDIDKTDDEKKFREETPKWILDDIVLRSEVRETLDDVVMFCQHKDQLIREWNLDKFLKGNSSIGINFYGEPGTGKTISAEAIASALGKRLLKPIIRKFKIANGAQQKRILRGYLKKQKKLVV